VPEGLDVLLEHSVVVNHAEWTVLDVVDFDLGCYDVHTLASDFDQVIYEFVDHFGTQVKVAFLRLRQLIIQRLTKINQPITSKQYPCRLIDFNQIPGEIQQRTGLNQSMGLGYRRQHCW
jgi:hypothetical protein